MAQFPRWSESGVTGLGTVMNLLTATAAVGSWRQTAAEPTWSAGQGSREDEQRLARISLAQTALGRLPETERALLMLRLYQGLSCETIAQRTGLAEDEVRRIQLRAVRRLRRLLGRDPDAR